MRPVPSWFPLVSLILGLALTLPVLVVGMRRGTVRRTLVVVGAMSLVWGGLTVFFVLFGLPPLGVLLILLIAPWPLVIRAHWPRIRQEFGFEPTQRQ